MRALRRTILDASPEIVNLSRPRPGLGEVLVQVGGIGVSDCRLKLGRQDGSADAFARPAVTFGNEMTGWVAQIGAGVHSLNVGDAVALYGVQGCGACRNCLNGEANYCASVHFGAVVHDVDNDSGVQDYVLVHDEHRLLPLPEGLSPLAAAPLTGAGLTAYHCVSAAMERLSIGSTAVVIGAGAIGHLIIQALRATTSADIVAVDVRPEPLRLAELCGADTAILTTDDVDADIRAAVGPHGAVAVFDTVGTTQTLEHAAAAVAANGWIGIVGLGGGALPVSITALPFGVTIRPTVLGSRRDLAAVLELAGRGEIRPQTHVYPLADAAAAYAKVGSGGVVGCAVISVNAEYAPCS